jgi:hypothetical protein
MVIELQRIVMLSVSLHGCGTLCLLLKGKRSVRRFDKMVLRRYVELKEIGSGATVGYTHERAEKLM